MTEATWTAFISKYGETLKLDQRPNDLRIEKAKAAALIYLQEKSAQAPTANERVSRANNRADFRMAYADLLARVAEEDEDLKKFRRDHLPDGLLPDDPREINAWVDARNKTVTMRYMFSVEVEIGKQSPILPNKPIPPLPESVIVGGGDAPFELFVPSIENNGFARPIRVSGKGVLGELVRLQKRYADLFLTTEAGASVFVLCGVIPLPSLMTLTASYQERETAWGALSRERLTLSFTSESTPRDIYEFLLRTWKKKRQGGRQRPVADETLRLVRFWLKHGENKVREWKKLNPRSKIDENKVYNRRAKEGLEYLFGKGTASRMFRRNAEEALGALKKGSN